MQASHVIGSSVVHTCAGPRLGEVSEAELVPEKQTL